MVTERPPFIEQLQRKWAEGKFVCVGLDPDLDRIPKYIKEGYINPHTNKGFGMAIEDFAEKIVEKTGDLVCAFKPNIAFFEGLPEADGEEELSDLVRHIHSNFPDVPVIGDIKRADIGNTNKGYARMAFEKCQFDAITTNPYFGADTFEPFLQYPGKGLIILCRTTNPGSKELQDMPIDLSQAIINGLLEDEYKLLSPVADPDILTVYEMVAFLAAKRWNKLGNLGLVVGATHPEAFARVRKLAGDLPFLIPGIGTQGGDLEKTLKYAPDSKGQGMIINSGSAIIFASSGEDFAEAARAKTLELHNQIQELRTA